MIDEMEPELWKQWVEFIKEYLADEVRALARRAR
jgi:hypothetical protein